MTVSAGLGRGISFPPRVGADGRVAWSSDATNVAESIEIIVKTELGERLRLPDFGAGLGAYLFEPNTTATRRQIEDRIAKAVTQWEPRVRIDQVQVVEDADDPLAVQASIRYHLVATDRELQTALTVPLGA